MIDGPSVSYDDREHWAAPIELRWATRAGRTSGTRWVFARCCKSVGTPDAKGVIRTFLSGFEQEKMCSLKAPQEMHPGSMVLCRTTRAQVTKHGGLLPLARWGCCGKVALKSWDSKWDRFLGCIPQEAFSPGCCVWDPSKAADGGKVAPSENNSMEVARVALPLSRRAGGGHSSGGGSSGLEQVHVIDRCVALADVLSTQRWINTTTFTTPTGPRDLFSVLARLISDQDSPDEVFTLPIPPELQEILRTKILWPPIRVARRWMDTQLSCIDNRRLFMLKVLGFVDVDVHEIEWMSEFDDKLRQRDPPAAEMQLHRRTDDEAVSDARSRVNAMLASYRKRQLIQDRLAAAKLVVQDLEAQLQTHLDESEDVQLEDE